MIAKTLLARTACSLVPILLALMAYTIKCCEGSILLLRSSLHPAIKVPQMILHITVG
jgi:hypothetical protein